MQFGAGRLPNYGSILEARLVEMCVDPGLSRHAELCGCSTGFLAQVIVSKLWIASTFPFQKRRILGDPSLVCRYIVCMHGASKPVSHISQTMTSFSGSSAFLVRFARSSGESCAVCPSSIDTTC